jgi:hypothetical protein
MRRERTQKRGKVISVIGREEGKRRNVDRREGGSAYGRNM